jgi:hypothetical protein
MQVILQTTNQMIRWTGKSAHEFFEEWFPAIDKKLPAGKCSLKVRRAEIGCS